MLGEHSTTATLVIEAGRTERHYWRDLWAYRELLFLLARRDVAVRYKQTVFGIAWAIVKPLATMLIFVFVFGRLAKLPSDGAPYSLLVLSGMLPWFFFSSALGEASESMISNSNLLTKIYFPRLIIPLSTGLVALLDLAIGLVLLAGLMVTMGYPLTLRLLALPSFVFVAFCCALGLGLWFAALNVKFRDFRFVVPFLLMLGIYASPVGYSTNVIPEHWRILYSLNPLVGVIEGFRWAILGDAFAPHAEAVALSCGFAVLMLVSGTVFFRRTERSFADVI